VFDEHPSIESGKFTGFWVGQSLKSAKITWYTRVGVLIPFARVPMIHLWGWKSPSFQAMKQMAFPQKTSGHSLQGGPTLNAQFGLDPPGTTTWRRFIFYTINIDKPNS